MCCKINGLNWRRNFNQFFTQTKCEIASQKRNGEQWIHRNVDPLKIRKMIWSEGKQEQPPGFVMKTQLEFRSEANIIDLWLKWRTQREKSQVSIEQSAIKQAQNKHHPLSSSQLERVAIVYKFFNCNSFSLFDLRFLNSFACSGFDGIKSKMHPQPVAQNSSCFSNVNLQVDVERKE